MDPPRQEDETASVQQPGMLCRLFGCGKQVAGPKEAVEHAPDPKQQQSVPSPHRQRGDPFYWQQEQQQHLQQQQHDPFYWQSRQALPQADAGSGDVEQKKGDADGPEFDFDGVDMKVLIGAVSHIAALQRGRVARRRVRGVIKLKGMDEAVEFEGERRFISF